MRAIRCAFYSKTLYSFALALFGAVMLLPASLVAQQTNCEEGAQTLVNTPPGGTTPDDIIQRFSANETAFKQAQMAYTYTMDVTVQTLEGNTVSGEFRKVSDIHWEQGVFKELVTFAPESSLRDISLTKEDFEDIYRSAFVLAREDLPQYRVVYAGQQHVDEVDTYVFDVSPRQMEKGKRYFQGRVWVDKSYFVVLKSCGKSVGQTVPQTSRKKKRKGTEENVSPTMVCYREQIDGKYFFPTYARADETLQLATTDIRVREIIKYKNYKHAQ